MERDTPSKPVKEYVRPEPESIGYQNANREYGKFYLDIRSLIGNVMNSYKE
jgi:hypothetical protein